MAEASLPDDVDGEMEHDPTTVSAGLDAEEVPPPPRHADLQTEVSLVDGGGDFEVGSTVVTDSPTFDGPAPSMAVPPTYDGPSPPMADADDPTTDFAKPQDVDEAPDTIQPTGEESQPGAPVADWEGARPVIAVQAPPPRRPTHPDSIPPIEPRRDEDEDDEDEDDDDFDYEEDDDDWEEGEYEALYNRDDEPRKYSMRAPRRFRDEEQARPIPNKKRTRRSRQLLDDPADFDDDERDEL
jgi:hypothetical protein